MNELRSKSHEEQAIGQLRQRLQAVYGERSVTDVQDAVDSAVRRFDTARIRDYVPLLVERISRELSGRALASASALALNGYLLMAC